HEVAGRENSAQLFSFAAGGFRDFTRIASSHPEMWRDICLANRDRLRAELARYSKKLEQVNRLLDEPQALEKLFAEARAARERQRAASGLEEHLQPRAAARRARARRDRAARAARRRRYARHDRRAAAP